jgi:hypothetical protein
MGDAGEGKWGTPNRCMEKIVQCKNFENENGNPYSMFPFAIPLFIHKT